MARFNNRIPRSWFFILFAAYLFYKIFLAPDIDFDNPASRSSVSSLSRGIDTGMFIGLIYAVRGRLHDQGRSGWWALLAIGSVLFLTAAALLPIIASTPEGKADAEQWSALLYGLSALTMVPIAILMVRPGTPGPNRFGIQPQVRTSTEVSPNASAAPSPPTFARSLSQADALEALEKLAELKGRSLLTEAEFEQQKASLLRQL